jgi:hypothetical protein
LVLVAKDLDRPILPSRRGQRLPLFLGALICSAFRFNQKISPETPRSKTPSSLGVLATLAVQPIFI